MTASEGNVPDLGVIILTYNEERHIARALQSVSTIARQVVVVDSFSSDRTIELAHSFGATVLQNKFVNQAKQFQWALDNSALATEWVMRLDADEIIEPDLSLEIAEKLPRLEPEVCGVNLRRKHIFLGRWIRHGGRFPVILLRIWRSGHGRIEDRWMDEHMIVEGGTTVMFKGGFADHNLNDLTFFTTKHNDYATREAVEVLNKKYGFIAREELISSAGSSWQASSKRIIKERLYNKLPFWLAPILYFIFRYIIQLGFLDGRSGLIYHVLQGFWYRFLVGAKIYEFEQVLSRIADLEARKVALRQLTGLNI